ncbi:MAG: glycosyltransferase family 4 protein [Sedimentisphaerales bacterium]|jgi:glycosyltransferase involved in cell wall biosynthesis|nr:glycosyltransferase family 4 protein [Sedimentisphaerales bacterium]
MTSQTNKVEPIVINPCLGRRYSGINASLIAVFPHLDKLLPMAVMGLHVPGHIRRIKWVDLLQQDNSRWRIWHARRNMDMVVGLLLRRGLGLRLLMVFTSAAQRSHTWTTRCYVKKMDAIIAPTRAAASFLSRPAVIVPHGVDTNLFFPPADRAVEWARTGLPGRYGIGVFGRVRPQKGTGDFVDAIMKVLPERPDWTAVIIGQTTAEYAAFQRTLVQRLVNAGLEKRVRFVGFLPNPSQIPGWYRALSVVVCPSRVEGFGLPCLEAMASGCPVVATRTGAWPEIVEDGLDGYLVPCGDVEAMADAIRRITADPSRLAVMGRHARQKIEDRYQITNEAAGIFGVYRQLLAKVGQQV